MWILCMFVTIHLKTKKKKRNMLQLFVLFYFLEVNIFTSHEMKKMQMQTPAAECCDCVRAGCLYCFTWQNDNWYIHKWRRDIITKSTCLKKKAINNKINQNKPNLGIDWVIGYWEKLYSLLICEWTYWAAPITYLFTTHFSSIIDFSLAWAPVVRSSLQGRIRGIPSSILRGNNAWSVYMTLRTNQISRPPLVGWKPVRMPKK